MDLTTRTQGHPVHALHRSSSILSGTVTINWHGFKRLFPQLQKLLQKKNTQTKREWKKIYRIVPHTRPKEATKATRRATRFFGDMDPIEYWYWKVVDYRIQVTFGNMEKKNFLYNLTIHVRLNVLPLEIASVHSRTILCYQHKCRDHQKAIPENNE